MMTMPPIMPAITPSEARPNMNKNPIPIIPSTAIVSPNGPRMKVQTLLIIVCGLAPPETVWA